VPLLFPARIGPELCRAHAEPRGFAPLLKRSLVRRSVFVLIDRRHHSLKSQRESTQKYSEAELRRPAVGMSTSIYLSCFATPMPHRHTSARARAR